jgi:O-antigen/teichoic acid export membrane protein
MAQINQAESTATTLPQGRFSRWRAQLMSFAQHGMLRSIGILVSGTVIAQGITMAVMPISTRLYTPENFSSLSVFSSLMGILVVIICLRFDAAIVMPESDEDAANLFVLSIIIAFFVSLLLGFGMMIIPKSAYHALNEPGLLPYIWMLPLGVFIGGVYLAAQAWHVRRKRFSEIARNRVGQAIGAGAAQVGFGFAGIAPFGLIFSHIVNYGAGSIGLVAQIWRGDRSLLRTVSVRGMAKVARTYERFPKYSVWEGIANGLSNSAPIIIIAAMASGPEAGYLALSLFVLQAPMALLGNAVGQVFLSEAPKAHREKRLGQYTGEVLSGLTVAGIGPLIFAAIASPAIFGIVFGASWGRSGELVTWMAPWFFLQFLASPICNALHVTGNQRTMMIFHVIGMVLRVGGVLLAGFVAVDLISEVWAVTGWIFYAGYLATILFIVRMPTRMIGTMARRSIPSIAMGVLGGVFIVYVAAMLWPTQ